MTIKRTRVVSPEVAAALAANGADPDVAGGDEPGVTATPGTETETPAPGATNTTETPAAGDPPAGTETTATPAPAAAVATNDALGALTAQLTAAQASVIELNVKLARSEDALTAATAAAEKTTAQITSLNDQINAMAEPLRTAVSRLAVALNTDTSAYAAMSGSDLVQAFNTLNTKFEAKFKVGAVSKPNAAVTPQGEPAQTADQAELARRLSVRAQSKKPTTSKARGK